MIKRNERLIMKRKISVNDLCPCGSGVKYKKCCRIYHKGALPKDALTLMKSRYSAYAVNDADYIIKTTDRENPDYTDDIKSWKESILSFSKNGDFKKLKIVEFIDSGESAVVEFEAYISDSVMKERSRFVKRDGKWLYLDGDIK